VELVIGEKLMKSIITQKPGTFAIERLVAERSAHINSQRREERTSISLAVKACLQKTCALLAMNFLPILYVVGDSMTSSLPGKRVSIGLIISCDHYHHGNCMVIHPDYSTGYYQ
jgi:hypothetical protein